MKYSDAQKAWAQRNLAKFNLNGRAVWFSLKPGYSITFNSRLRLYFIRNNHPENMTYEFAITLGWKVDSDSYLKVEGGGEDMMAFTMRKLNERLKTKMVAHLL